MGNVVTVNGDIHVYGEVNGDVVSVLGRVTVYETGSVLGNAVAVAGGLDVQPGGQVVGDQVSVAAGGFSLSWNIFERIFQPRFNLGWQVFLLVVNLTFAILAYAIVPQRVQKVKVHLQQRPAANALWGLLIIPVAMVLSLLLLITIIGGPAIVLMTWFAWLLGYTALALLIGEAILARREIEPFAVVTLGVLVLRGITALPVIGWLAYIGIALVTVGAGVTSKFGANGGVAE
ncbi:MAG: polymer-forming cytoskeletal protein [Firmicutes bacterium]|nr:polymer-forming cytoskeletal protein [Bacillota bacterium]